MSRGVGVLVTDIGVRVSVARGVGVLVADIGVRLWVERGVGVLVTTRVMILLVARGVLVTAIESEALGVLVAVEQSASTNCTFDIKTIICQKLPLYSPQVTTTYYAVYCNRLL